MTPNQVKKLQAEMAPRYFKFEMITLPLVATVKMCEKMIMIDK